MSFAVGSNVSSDHVPLRVDSIALAGNCPGEIERDKRIVALDKSMLITILAVVKADDLSFRIDAGDPRKGGAREVDRAESAIRHQKSVKGVIAA